LATGAGVLGVVLVASFAATRPLGSAAPAPSFYSLASQLPGVQIGNRAPGLTAATGSAPLPLVDLDGDPIDLAAFAGRPIWIVFWKTACPPCEDEAPDVLASYRAHQGDGLVILAVDVWDTAETVRDYQATHQLGYPLGLDPSAGFKDAYGVWGAPIHYFIDRSGLIRNRYFGPMSRDLIEEYLGSIL
jgi:cytochrome c biogenesis protein CcmG/thiol:disulfide interchange protein DsbE